MEEYKIIASNSNKPLLYWARNSFMAAKLARSDGYVVVEVYKRKYKTIADLTGDVHWELISHVCWR